MCESDLKGNIKRYDSEIGLLVIDRRDEKVNEKPQSCVWCQRWGCCEASSGRVTICNLHLRAVVSVGDNLSPTGVVERDPLELRRACLLLATNLQPVLQNMLRS